MERIGIIEIAEIERNRRSSIQGFLEPQEPTNQFLFRTVLENNFQIVPEGFTAVYLGDEELQVVPNEIIPRIKRMVQIKGFSHVPEDHELYLFANRWDANGQYLNAVIIEMVCHWLDLKLDL